MIRSTSSPEGVSGRWADNSGRQADHRSAPADDSSNVCLKLSQLSQLYFMQYMGLCVFSLPISLTMIVRVPVLDLIIIKSEVWPICHCLGLGHETMICAVYLSIFLFLYHLYHKPTAWCWIHCVTTVWHELCFLLIDFMPSVCNTVDIILVYVHRAHNDVHILTSVLNSPSYWWHQTIILNLESYV